MQITAICEGAREQPQTKGYEIQLTQRVQGSSHLCGTIIIKEHLMHLKLLNDLVDLIKSILSCLDNVRVLLWSCLMKRVSYLNGLLFRTTGAQRLERTLIIIAVQDKNCKIKPLSPAAFGTSVSDAERATYIRLLGTTLCPSLNHVATGWGKEARAGGLMTAALPWVTVFLCSSVEKFPKTGGRMGQRTWESHKALSWKTWKCIKG